MNRLLLAFMALLASLLAQGGPAQARECGAGASQVGAMEAPLAQIRVAVQVQATNGAKARRELPAKESNCARSRKQIIYLPTVQLGSDRARE